MALHARPFYEFGHLAACQFVSRMAVALIRDGKRLSDADSQVLRANFLMFTCTVDAKEARVKK